MNVIKGVQGEFYPCKSDIFESTYERVGMSTDSAHEALENLRLWLEDTRENHPRFANETALFLLMLARFKNDYYPGEGDGREAT